jgi:hemerythrin-like domain-containing protein
MAALKHLGTSEGASVLIGIRRSGAIEGEADVVTALLDCHDRIRRFTGTTAALAATRDAPRAEIAEAARAARRYFVEALPNHSADEEQSIAPRLLALALPDSVREAVLEMTREHAPIHATLNAIVPRLEDVAADPGRLAAHADALHESVSRLSAMWAEHLGREESIVFPAVRLLLPKEAQDEILKEMRARRAPSQPS